jgi:predicted NBD/HSP70 family sugar kinase
MDRAIGIDVGGTNVKAGVVSERYGLIELLQEPTQTVREAQLIEQITTIVEKFRKKHNIKGVGIGIAGLVNHEKGTIIKSPHLPLKQTPLKKILEKRLGISVVIDNDVNASGLGERFFGAGRNALNFIYLTIGTGIGGAIFVKGELYRGATGFAGELGHMIVDLNGPFCDCNAQGCLEALASGTTLEKITGLAGSEVAARAEAGSKRARDALRFIGKHLGVGIANVINIFDPELVLLGGKVVKADKFILDSAMEEIKRRTFGYNYRNVRIEITSLRDKAGPLGAATMVLHNV